MDCSNEQEKRECITVINPKIVTFSEKIRIYKEGCLSIPDINEEVARPEVIDVSYQDLTGETKTTKFEGLWATCFQHELDHLDGKLFIDHLKPVKRALVKNKIKKLNKKR
jgi:peptide deformylase